jgi:SAM-dependent methyltransferase
MMRACGATSAACAARKAATHPPRSPHNPPPGPPGVARRAFPSVARALLDEWDAFHVRLDGGRLPRLDLVVDLLEVAQPRARIVWDLGTGPGALARRVLERFPRARVVGIDLNPALLAVAAGALSRFGPRFVPVRADLRRRGWELALPGGRPDAIVSHLALHWMRPAEMARLYATLARRLPRGGIFCSADDQPWTGRASRFNDLAWDVREVRVRHGRRVPRKVFVSDHDRWWKKVERVPELRSPLAQWRSDPAREERPPTHAVPLEGQVRRLSRAGFREIAVVGQDLNNRTLLAYR